MGIRETLGLPVLDLLGEFILLDKEDKNEILEHQAKLLALYLAQKDAPDFAQKDLCKAPRYGKNNSLMLESEMRRLNVTPADIKNTRKMVISRAGMPPDVPLIGKIAIDLEFIENDFLEALVKGQVGESILKTVNALERFDFKTDRWLHSLIEAHDEGQIARNYIGKYDDDSPAVVTTQACLHLAELFVTLFDVEDAQDINSWAAICEIFHAVGYASLESCADHLAALGHLSDAREIYLSLPEAFLIELHNDTLEPVKSLLENRLKQLHDDGRLDNVLYAKACHLMKRRFEQIDLSTLMNTEAQHEDLDLKERLRRRLSSAKE